jgi:hypothetical protein
LSLARAHSNQLHAVRSGRIESVDADAPAGLRPIQPHQSKQRFVTILSNHPVSHETTITFVRADRRTGVQQRPELLV